MPLTEKQRFVIWHGSSVVQQLRPDRLLQTSSCLAAVMQSVWVVPCVLASQDGLHPQSAIALRVRSPPTPSFLTAFRLRRVGGVMHGGQLSRSVPG